VTIVVDFCSSRKESVDRLKVATLEFIESLMFSDIFLLIYMSFCSEWDFLCQFRPALSIFLLCSDPPFCLDILLGSIPTLLDLGPSLFLHLSSSRLVTHYLHLIGTLKAVRSDGKFILSICISFN